MRSPRTREELSNGVDSEPSLETGDAVGRRSYLKLTGVAVGALAVGTASGTASASTGYGDGGYGAGGYGETDPALVVQTNAATDVTETSMTLTGELTDLGGASWVDLAFEWRVAGSSETTRTPIQTLTRAGTFSADITGLSSETTYEFRAVAQAGDDDTAVGSMRTATTAKPDPDPVVERYRVVSTDASSGAVDVTAEWAVSDVNGDLDSVLVVVYDDAGTVVDVTANDVGGAAASGSDSFTLAGDGTSEFRVQVAVADVDGNAVTESEYVTA